MSLIAGIKKGYLGEIWVLNGVKDIFLLLVRLYFGWGFFIAGTGKLANIADKTEYFRKLHIPMPEFNAYMAGTTETVCGVLLILGLASRIITIPLIGTMIVAFLTAHSDTLPWNTHWDVAPLATAAAFPYLFGCLTVLIFGPGLISVDGIIPTFLVAQEPQPGATTSPGDYHGASQPGPNTPALPANRRVMLRLAVATLGGLTTGAIAYHFLKKPEAKGDSGNTGGTGNASDNGDKSDKGDKSEVASGPLPLLLRGPLHVCRGINTGKNDGKPGTTNDCAGQAHCATVSAHSCDGMNDCKGHGGCGDNPGENECSGKGHCAVPMTKAETWAKARKRFEELMTAAHRKFGKAPPS